MSEHPDPGRPYARRPNPGRPDPGLTEKAPPREAGRSAAKVVEWVATLLAGLFLIAVLAAPAVRILVVLWRWALAP